MSKHPFDVLINKKRIIFALFKINGVNLILVAAHLCARINNAHVRKRQLEMVENMERTLLEHQCEITEEIADAISKNNIIILGDLNLHHPNEISLIESVGLYDLWLEKHSHNDGITWDPSKNRLINVMLPFDNRRMRLDRICMLESKQMSISDITMFADQRISKCYLYPSDHFGLRAELILGKPFKPKDNRHKREMKKIAKETQYRSIKCIIALRILAGAFLALFLLGGIGTIACFISRIF
ncbi:unnamed protein product [Moneuplotes crassus]|uniref:Endonuclease/exonuclease/phosphatase domain-containing protein n=1 Tax=Euplotes crassus TaxID=5936 RepID=A0AAD1XLG9_EUPCR|nr:unnamed protein product [Moneuplotes crassus]